MEAALEVCNLLVQCILARPAPAPLEVDHPLWVSDYRSIVERYRSLFAEVFGVARTPDRAAYRIPIAIDQQESEWLRCGTGLNVTFDSLVLGCKRTQGSEVGAPTTIEEPSKRIGEAHRYPLRISSISLGNSSSAFPTTPRSAKEKIGASSSLFTAMILFAPFIPTMCCVAPEIPKAK